MKTVSGIMCFVGALFAVSPIFGLPLPLLFVSLLFFLPAVLLFEIARDEKKEKEKKMEVKVIPQGHMSSECWSIQVWGLDHCKTCPSENKKECGGKNIRKTGKNELGYLVPLGVDPLGD